MTAFLTYPNFIRLPDDKNSFNRVAKRHKFPDTSKVFYIEPKFSLENGVIVRKDKLISGDKILGEFGCGFLPSNINEFKEGCRVEYNKFKQEEVLINQCAVDLGAKEPAYNDKAVTSTKYHI